MNNYDCAVRVLAAHREARRWNDEAVAADLLAQLGVDPAADATNAAPLVLNAHELTEEQVRANELAARQYTEQAAAQRNALAQLTVSRADQNAATTGNFEQRAQSDAHGTTVAGGQTETVGASVGPHGAASLDEANAAAEKSEEAIQETAERSASTEGHNA